MVAMVALGICFPMYAGADAWRWIVFAYLFAASVLPIWALKTRATTSRCSFIGMIAFRRRGRLLENPEIKLPAFVGFEVNGLDPFPILFVTTRLRRGLGLPLAGLFGDVFEDGLEQKATCASLAAARCRSKSCWASFADRGRRGREGGALPKGTPFALFSTSVAGFLTNIFGVPRTSRPASDDVRVGFGSDVR